MPVSGYKEFIQKFGNVKDRSRLFAFILFDERPTHKAIEKFVDDHFTWLDSLAAAANMFGFAFLHRDSHSGEFKNPSLQVAGLFGIRANQLPGVIAFTMLPSAEKVRGAVYLPLKPSLFAEGGEVVEEAFADLFAVFQVAQDTSNSEPELLKKLQEEIASLKRHSKLRPIKTYLGERLETLAKLPDKFLESMAEAFGEGLAKRVGG